MTTLVRAWFGRDASPPASVVSPIFRAGGAYLPHKGHLIPDQEWFAVFDAIDADIIDALASG